MSTFAFRSDFPKPPKGGESWDRKQVARALRSARSVGKLTGERSPESTVQGAATYLEQRSQRPTVYNTDEWSDNRDREVLAQTLRKRVGERED